MILFLLREACEELWGGVLKDLVMERGERGAGPLVVRPDSGDPATVVVKVLEALGGKFGSTLNSKGYKVLPDYLRVIQVGVVNMCEVVRVCVQGDGISYESLSAIMEHMKAHQWSVDNLAFGSGGALLQKLHRDTQKCAYKCSYAIVNGEGVSSVIHCVYVSVTVCIGGHIQGPSDRPW